MWPLFLDVLRAHGTVTFLLADLAGRHGLVELDKAIIALDRGNTAPEMRATIAHELHHLECPDCSDDDVEAMTAELLVPLPAALAAAGGADPDTIAANLFVDPKLVRARLRSLEPRRDSADDAS